MTQSIETRLGLAGRRIWVVGAGGGGIGTAVATELARAGAHVSGLDRDADALEATIAACAEAEGAGGTFSPHVLDATDRAAFERFAQAEASATRAPDGLVNIVGGLGRDQFGPIVETPDPTFDAVLRLNLRPAWLASQAFARLHLARRNEGARGSIVHLASIVALQAMPFGATYAMAKAALISLARSQALEWGRRGIRVNTIAAGTIRTPRAGYAQSAQDRRVIPLGRRGDAQDISGTALFLLSDLADWVTGQVIAVDGGASIKPAYLDDDGLPVFVDDDEMRRKLFGKGDPIP